MFFARQGSVDGERRTGEAKVTVSHIYIIAQYTIRKQSACLWDRANAYELCWLKSVAFALLMGSFDGEVLQAVVHSVADAGHEPS